VTIRFVNEVGGGSIKGLDGAEVRLVPHEKIETTPGIQHGLALATPTQNTATKNSNSLIKDSELLSNVDIPTATIACMFYIMAIMHLILAISSNGVMWFILSLVMFLSGVMWMLSASNHNNL